MPSPAAIHRKGVFERPATWPGAGPDAGLFCRFCRMAGAGLTFFFAIRRWGACRLRCRFPPAQNYSFVLKHMNCCAGSVLDPDQHALSLLLPPLPLFLAISRRPKTAPPLRLLYRRIRFPVRFQRPGHRATLFFQLRRFQSPEII